MADYTCNLYGGRLDEEIGKVTALFRKAEELAREADIALEQPPTPDAKLKAAVAWREASAARLEAQVAWARLKQDMDSGARLRPTD